MKSKDNYQKKIDPITGTIHFYPKNGRKHFFDDCWCKPKRNKRNDTISHYEVKENSAKCDS